MLLQVTSPSATISISNHLVLKTIKNKTKIELVSEGSEIHSRYEQHSKGWNNTAGHG